MVPAARRRSSRPLPSRPLARWIGALLLASRLVAADVAAACTQTDDILLMEPAAGATGVPTGVELWVRGAQSPWQ